MFIERTTAAKSDAAAFAIEVQATAADVGKLVGDILRLLIVRVTKLAAVQAMFAVAVDGEGAERGVRGHHRRRRGGHVGGVPLGETRSSRNCAPGTRHVGEQHDIPLGLSLFLQVDSMRNILSCFCSPDWSPLAIHAIGTSPFLPTRSSSTPNWSRKLARCAILQSLSREMIYDGSFLQKVNFRRPGTLRLATTTTRMDEFRRYTAKDYYKQGDVCRTTLIGPEQVKKLVPLLNIDHVLARFLRSTEHML